MKNSPTLFSALVNEFDDRVVYQGRLVAGVDEAGRGPLAGPVVAAAVILAPDADLSRMNDLGDSKTLTPQQRDRLYDSIHQCSLAIGVGMLDAETIDRLNILQATLSAMKQAVEQLSTAPDLVLVDGLQTPDVACPAQAIVKGDGLSASIAAASIIAKVTRDRLMEELHYRQPLYGFHRHKGYGTAYHLAALRVFGACPHHRRSFRPVSECEKPGPPSHAFRRIYAELSDNRKALTPSDIALFLQRADGQLSQDEIYLLKNFQT